MNRSLEIGLRRSITGTRRRSCVAAAGLSRIECFIEWCEFEGVGGRSVDLKLEGEKPFLKQMCSVVLQMSRYTPVT